MGTALLDIAPAERYAASPEADFSPCTWIAVLRLIPPFFRNVHSPLTRRLIYILRLVLVNFVFTCKEFCIHSNGCTIYMSY